MWDTNKARLMLPLQTDITFEASTSRAWNAKPSTFLPSCKRCAVFVRLTKDSTISYLHTLLEKQTRLFDQQSIIFYTCFTVLMLHYPAFQKICHCIDSTVRGASSGSRISKVLGAEHIFIFFFFL